jgi:hypothetical protein
MAAGLRGDLLGAEAAVAAGRPGTAALWTGILVGPTAWAADLLTRYALVHWSCGSKQTAVLNLVSLIALLLVTGAGAVAAWALSALPSRPTDGGHPLDRSRFMALGGIAMSVLFALAIMAGAFPQWVLDACS